MTRIEKMMTILRIKTTQIMSMILTEIL